MVHQFRVLFLFILFSLCLSAFLPAGQQDRIPGEVWMKYVSPEEAGFSAEKLAEARAYYDSISSSAVFVIYKGAVLVDWGETSRRFRCHSARKSLMSGMYGIYVDNGIIDTNKTLAQLGIDDEPAPLTDEEKTARIVDLLSARSGIYLLAAYEPSQNPKPERGAFPPGTNWCYNNWDFNTLLTILEQETGIKFFDEFESRFGQPLQMQDYDPSYGYYHYERDKSMHPAYPFRMSARDMARFGLLYLYKGQWGDKRILSEEYIAHSIEWISTDSWTGGYGYMWWLYGAEPYKSLGMFSALGLGEQSIDVIPGADMVFVLRTNTYIGDQVGSDQRLKLLSMILDARTGEFVKNPQLISMTDPEPEYVPQPITAEEAKIYVKEYPITGTLSAIDVKYDGNQLTAEFGEGPIPMPKIGPDHFIIEDFNDHIYFEEDSLGQKRLIEARLLLHEARMNLTWNNEEGAMSVLEKAAGYFPDDSRVYEASANFNLFRASRAIDQAIEDFEKVIELSPDRSLDRSPIAWWLPEIQGRVSPPEISSDYQGKLAGKYGPRTIDLENGELYYTREGRDRLKLTPLTKTVFAVEGIDYFRIRFDTDATGRVFKITGLYSDGRWNESLRD